MNEIVLLLESQIKNLELHIEGSPSVSIDDLSAQGRVLEQIENLRLASELVKCAIEM
jgi:competence protein ComGC